VAVFNKNPGEASVTSTQAAARPVESSWRASKYAATKPALARTAVDITGAHVPPPSTKTNGAAQSTCPMSVMSPQGTKWRWPVLTKRKTVTR